MCGVSHFSLLPALLCTPCRTRLTTVLVLRSLGEGGPRCPPERSIRSHAGPPSSARSDRAGGLRVPANTNIPRSRGTIGRPMPELRATTNTNTGARPSSAYRTGGQTRSLWNDLTHITLVHEITGHSPLAFHREHEGRVPHFYKDYSSPFFSINRNMYDVATAMNTVNPNVAQPTTAPMMSQGFIEPSRVTEMRFFSRLWEPTSLHVISDGHPPFYRDESRRSSRTEKLPMPR